MHRKRARVDKRNLRFIHYTDGEAAQSIIRNKAVWIRSTTCMSDFEDVHHGLACFARSWEGYSSKALRSALNKSRALHGRLSMWRSYRTNTSIGFRTKSTRCRRYAKIWWVRVEVV